MDENENNKTVNKTDDSNQELNEKKKNDEDTR